VKIALCSLSGAVLVLLLSVLALPRETVTIICEDDFAPYGYRSQKGAAAGFSTDVIVAAYNEVGIEVEFLVMPYKRGMHMIEKGRALACYNTNNDQVNLEKHDFAEQPLFNGEMVIWARQDYEGTMSVGELAASGEPIGTTNGYNYDAPGVDFDYNPNIEKDLATSVTLTLRKLLRNRYDFAAAEKRVALVAISKNPELYGGKIKIVGSIARPGLFLTFSRQYPGSERYRRLFDSGFKTIKENGTYEMLRLKWDGLIQQGDLP
jgi:polar amino acid transport system substrate-binding protein